MRKSIKFIIYISFVIMFTFSITCQNVHAYYNQYVSDLTFQFDGAGDGGGTQIFHYDSDCRNNKRGIFLVISSNDLAEKIGDSNLNYIFYGFNKDMITSNMYLYLTNNGNNNGLNVINRETVKEGETVCVHQTFARLNDYFYEHYNLTLKNYCMFSYHDSYRPQILGSVESMFSIDYVNDVDDVVKFFNGNDSVVKNGDPEHPPVLQDNTLPVPQSLTCDLHNSYTASNPYIEGSWENPKNASWDAIKDEVKIHIQYKPKFQFYKRFLSVKDGQRSAHQFIDLGTQKNENKNIWINAFPNTPNVNDNVIKFETLKQDMLDVSRMVGAGEIYYAGGATLLNGTQWRVRYEMPDGRVSYWAVYGVNSIGDVKSSDKVTFQDNEDNVVSADAVNYKNSWQTDPNNYDPDSINNSLLSRLRQALNDIQALPTDMETVASEGSSFANFLQKVWEKFPEIYIIFIGGLIIAIILRILGR